MEEDIMILESECYYLEELVEKNSKEPKGTMRDYLDNEVIKALQELMEDK